MMVEDIYGAPLKIQLMYMNVSTLVACFCPCMQIGKVHTNLVNINYA